MIYLSPKSLSKPLVAVILVAVFSTQLLAEEENKDPANLKKGVIASSSSSTTAEAVDVDTGDSEPGGEASLVSASIAKLSRGKCEVTLTNKSEKSSYSVHYRVIGVSKSGREDLRRSYSATVGPKKSVSRPLACNQDSNLSVELVSGKKTS